MTLFKLSASFALCLSVAWCQAPQKLLVQGLDGTSVTLSLDELSKMPRHTVEVVDHATPAKFEGVALSDILAKVTLPSGEKYHKSATSYYMLVEAKDGYRAVYAWAELDPSFMDKPMYVAIRRDGKLLSDKEGLFRLIAPGEKRPARWAWGVTSLKIKQAN